MDYSELLEKAKNNPDQSDYTQLRLSHTESTEYRPYDAWKRADTMSIYAAIHEGDLQEAAKIINQALDKYYLNIDAHMAATTVYKKLEDTEKLEYHRRFALGLLDSILKSGDGKSYQTAYQVINVMEEYAVLKIRGIPHNAKYEQSLRKNEDHYYDTFTFETPDKNKTLEIYFNIDLPYKQLNKDISKTQE